MTTGSTRHWQCSAGAPEKLGRDLLAVWMVRCPWAISGRGGIWPSHISLLTSHQGPETRWFLLPLLSENQGLQERGNVRIWSSPSKPTSDLLNWEAPLILPPIYLGPHFPRS